MKKATIYLIRYQAILVMLLIVGVFGYTANQVSLVLNSSPDPELVETQKKSATAEIAKIDVATINSLSNLTPMNGATGVTAVPKPDPFTP